jgi:hypothetical protein
LMRIKFKWSSKLTGSHFQKALEYY